jgi:predicted PurR-regulated permease PerM
LWVVTAGAAAVALGIAIVVIDWQLARPLAVLILGITVAAALAPVVAFLERRLPRFLAVLLVYVCLALIVAVIAWIAIPPLVSQAASAIVDLPVFIGSVQQWLNQQLHLNTGSLTQQLGGISTQLLALPASIADTLLDLVAIIFISIYWLLLESQMQRFLLSLFPPGTREQVAKLLHDMGDAMGGYLRGTAINGVILGFLMGIGLRLIGIQFALILGMLTALLEILPIIGPVIAGAIMVGVALTQSPTQALIVLVFVTALQQLETHILVPNIMHQQTYISPLLAVVAVLAGVTLGGVLGAAIAVPVTAALRIVVLEVIAPAVRRQTGAM